MDSILIETEEVRSQELKGFLTSRHVIKNILKWLAGLFSLTEEEKKEAGLFIGNHHD